MDKRDTGTDLCQPCRECPFRKNSPPGWLGPFTPEGILDEALEGFVCHRTHDAEVHQFCAGNAIFMNQLLKLSRDGAYATFQRSLKDADAEVVENVFASQQAFIEHHHSLGVFGAVDDMDTIDPESLGDA